MASSYQDVMDDVVDKVYTAKLSNAPMRESEGRAVFDKGTEVEVDNTHVDSEDVEVDPENSEPPADVASEDADTIEPATEESEKPQRQKIVVPKILHTSYYPAMASFAAPYIGKDKDGNKTVVKYPTAKEISAADLNLLEILMSGEELKEFYQKLEDHRKDTPEQSTTLDREVAVNDLQAYYDKHGTQPTDPTDKEIFCAWRVFKVQHPELDISSKKSVTSFRDYCWFERHWRVSLTRIQRLVGTQLRVVSFGSLAINAGQLASEEQQRKFEQFLQTALPERAQHRDTGKKKTKAKKDDARNVDPKLFTQEDMKLAKAALKKQGVVQNDLDSIVALRFHRDPNSLSYIRLCFAMNMIDSSRPKEQPTVNPEISLYWENLQSKSDVIDSSAYNITDVTHESFDEDLEKIFPHVSEGFFEKLRELSDSNRRLLLVTLKHTKDHAWTTNLMNVLPNMPPKHVALRAMMRQGPIINILVRENDTFVKSDFADSMVRFQADSKFDLLSRFFKGDAMYVSEKNMEHVSNMPKFTARFEKTLPTYHELSTRQALATWFEHKYFNPNKENIEYLAEAKFFPVVTTYSKSEKVYRVYFVFMKVDEDSKHLPRLVEGTKFQINFEHSHSNIQDPHPWRGSIIPGIEINPPDTLTAIVHRPQDKDYAFPNLTKLIKLEHDVVSKMNSQTAIKHIFEESGLNIKVVVQQNTQELKRDIQNFDMLTISKTLKFKDEMKHQRLTALQQFWQGSDYESLPRIGLSALYDPAHGDAYINYTKQSFNEDQLDAYKYWLHDGIVGNVMALAGTSGSGKSLLETCTLACLSLGINVPKQIIERQTDIRAALRSGVRYDEAIKPQKKYGIIGYENSAVVPFQLLAVAAQNLAADKTTHDIEKVFNKARKNFGHPPILVIRMYSYDTETKGVAARTMEDFDNPAYSPYIIQDHGIDTELALTLSDIYNAHWQGPSGKRHMRDGRYRLPEKSMSENVFQLAGLKDMSPGLKSKFSPDELSEIRKNLSPIVKLAQTPIESFRHAQKKVQQAAEFAMQMLLSVADVVICTPSASTDTLLTGHFHPHGILVENGSRITQAQLVGLFSRYWMTLFWFIAGDPRQLPPFVMGPSMQNPFQSMIKSSKLLQLVQNGFHVPHLKTTYRFGNQETLRLCSIANGGLELSLPEKAARVNEENVAKQFHSQAYEKECAVLFVTVIGAIPCVDSTDSVFCKQTAISAMSDLVKRVQKVQGKDVVILTDYAAQKRLLSHFLLHLVKAAKAEGKHDLATELLQVRISTIDGFMGEESSHVLLVLCANNGHLIKQYRTVVALTRGRDSVTVFGDAKRLTLSDIPVTHPLKLFVYSQDRAKRIVEVKAENSNVFSQLQSVLST